MCVCVCEGTEVSVVWKSLSSMWPFDKNSAPRQRNIAAVAVCPHSEDDDDEDDDDKDDDDDPLPLPDLK